MKHCTSVLLVLLFALSLGNGCKRFDEIDKHDLKIQDSVVVPKTGQHEVFEGIRIFMEVPEGYEYQPALLRFQKDSSTFIQALENPEIGFQSTKEQMIQKLDAAAKQGLKYYYRKEFKLQEFDAVLSYAPDNLNPGLDEMVLVFGDDEFTAMVAAKFPTDSIRIAGEIRDAMLSTYLDKEYQPDMSALMTFQVNTSGTEFKLHSNTSQIFNYTINGQGDPANPTENLILIMTMPAMKDFDQRIGYAQSMIPRYKSNGILIPKFEEQKILINNIEAYEITFKGAYNGAAVSCYQIVLGNENSTVLFLGQAYDRQDELMEQIIQISQTLRLN